MKKSELIKEIAKKQPHLGIKDVDLAVKCIIEKLDQALSTGNRIEIRGFGSFSIHKQRQRMGRNPKTGNALTLAEKYVSHFKPGKDLRDRVDSIRHKSEITD